MNPSIARLALEVRHALAPRLEVTAPVRFDALRHGTRLGQILTRARCNPGLPPTTYASTEIDAEEGEAWIWLNREAWPELAANTPRTRATVAHELGHVVLHAPDLVDLEAIAAAEPDHDEQLDREAWAFAAQLLIPDAALAQLPRLRPDALGRRFGVSAVMAAKRIEEWQTTSRGC